MAGEPAQAQEVQISVGWCRLVLSGETVLGSSEKQPFPISGRYSKAKRRTFTFCQFARTGERKMLLKLLLVIGLVIGIRPDTTYKYVYDSQVSTGVPQANSERSGTRTSCNIKLEAKKNDRITMTISNFREGRFNAPDPRPDIIKPIDWYERTELSPEQKEALQLPIEFSYRNGMIDYISLEKSDTPTSANIKRGILSMLQLNMMQTQKTDSSEHSNLMNILDSNKRINQPTSFRSLENTVEGECEVFYTVIPEKEQFEIRSTKVTKSINFERCRRRPQIRYNFRFADSCPTCESKYNDDEKYVKSSTIINYNLAGSPERFVIENATAESRYTFIPHNEKDNVIETIFMINLKLVDIEDSRERPSEMRQPVDSWSGIIYSMEADKKREKFSMNFDEPKPIFDNNMMHEDSVERAGNLLRKLLRHMNRKVDEISTETFAKLVEVLRRSTSTEIEHIHNRYYRADQSASLTAEEKAQALDILPHAIAQCGTIKCVKHVVKKTCNGEIPPSKANLAIMSMVNNRMASREIVDQLIELSRCDVTRRDPQLKRTVALTIGSTINAMCSDNEDRLAVDDDSGKEKRCTHQDKQLYVEKLVKKLRLAQTWEDKVLYLRTIGNAGIDISIFELEKFVTGEWRTSSPIIRTEAILAMRQLKDVMPKKIENILMPVAADRTENPVVRMAAINMIIDTLPKKNVLEQLIRIMKIDPSRQVTNFIQTSLKSIQESQQPCAKQM
ncbi:unnamed protein product [Soboliphyme baturini]|uniref:Vitellogenin domain-containing protein n=1 Tax=Soboliphyme baturini TaxID=241478 RepID=A0A183I8R0_9BILA|nr:unnamed protein product [Soboliphyme baturini]